MKRTLAILLLIVGVVGGYFFPFALPESIVTHETIREVPGETTHEVIREVVVPGFPDFPSTGAALPSAPAVFETSLASPISTSATSLTLTANSLRGGTAVSGYTCLTIDEGSANREDVCGTLSGTSMTSITRGIDPATGTSTVASLQYAHRRGANVKITDFPIITILRNQNNGIEGYPNALRYDNTITDALLTTSGTSTFATLNYVANTSYAGTVNGSETVKGIWEGATALESASSTILGSTGAGLALQARYATDTRNSATAGSKVLMSDISGYLKQSWLNMAGEAWSIAASTLYPLTLNNLSYVFPSARGASSTVLAENGSGGLSFVNMPRLLFHNSRVNVSTTASATTTLQSVTIPAGTIDSATASLRITGFWAPASAATECYADIEYGSGSATSTIAYIGNLGIPGIQRITSTLYATTSTAQMHFSDKVFNDQAIPPASSLVSTTSMALTAYNVAAQTYIAFSARSVGGASCRFVGGTVELLTN